MSSDLAQVKLVSELGARVPVPGVNGLVELAKYPLAKGRTFIGGFVQSLDLNTAVAVAVLHSAAFTWRALLRKGAPDGTNPIDDVVPLRRTTKELTWTRLDGRVVAPFTVDGDAGGAGLEIVWGVNVVNFGAVPATVLGFAGGIVGVDVPREFADRPEFLGFLRRE